MTWLSRYLVCIWTTELGWLPANHKIVIMSLRSARPNQNILIWSGADITKSWSEHWQHPWTELQIYMSGVRKPIVPTFKTGQRAIRKNTLATSYCYKYFSLLQLNIFPHSWPRSSQPRFRCWRGGEVCGPRSACSAIFNLFNNPA